MKNLAGYLVIFGLAFPSNVWAAGSCTVDYGEATRKCDSRELDSAKAIHQACLDIANSKPKPEGITGTISKFGISTEDIMGCKNKEETIVKPKIQEFITKCEEAINKCDSSCAAEVSNPVTGPDAQQKRQECTAGQPAQNRDQAKADLSQILPIIAALGMMLMQMMGKKDDKEEEKVDCVKTPYDTKCKPDVAAKDDPATFTTGNMRSREGGGDFLDSGLDGQNGVAMGTGAPATMSAAGTAGGSPGGMGAAGAGAGGGVSTKPGGKPEGDGAPKINLASTPGGGGGGGAAAGGRSGPHAGSGVGATRSAIDGNEKLAAAVEKAVQQRGIASDGPMGGITAAHSLDNFQKIEKRMQSERNQLNEF